MLPRLPVKKPLTYTLDIDPLIDLLKNLADNITKSIKQADNTFKRGLSQANIHKEITKVIETMLAFEPTFRSKITNKIANILSPSSQVAFSAYPSY